MKVHVLFLADVAGIAKKGQLHEVSEGYALNFLLPRQLAKLVTAETAQKIVTSDTAKQQGQITKRQTAKQRLAAMSGRIIHFEAKSSPAGSLYQHIGPSQVAAELKLPEEAVRLDQPMKHIGQATAKLIFEGQTIGEVTVDVKPHN